jgi:CHRD domain
MSRVKLAVVVALLGTLLTASAVAVAGGGKKSSTRLSGVEEVPAVLTTGEGKLKLKVDKRAMEIDYELEYEDLEGGNATAAHIHLGQELANGGVAADLCGGTKPACPPEGEVEGTIAAADVKVVEPQGLRADQTPQERFARLVKAIRFGLAYANVHTERSPDGEIRGQLGSDDDSDSDDDDRGGRSGRGGGDDDSDD